MDGVLVQTEPLKAQAHAAATRHYGGHVPAEFYATVMGQPVETVMRAFLTTGQVTAEPCHYLQTYEAVYQGLLETQLTATPDITDFLRRLKQDSYRLGLVTSDYRATCHQILTRLGLASWFDALITRDDVARIKPAPDAYLLGLKRLNLSANTTIVIEDSETGLQAAVGAGLRVLFFRHAFNARHNLTLAYHVFDSFNHPALIRIIETTLN
jgi:HAD superfamily hydrolase (TIGR01509 family)